jgi:hypothetical protein
MAPVQVQPPLVEVAGTHRYDRKVDQAYLFKSIKVKL